MISFKSGPIDGPLSKELTEKIESSFTENFSSEQRKLALILAEYDHSHAPSNWEGNIESHIEFILDWAEDFYSRDPDLVRELFEIWNRTDLTQRCVSCGQWGEISEFLYEEMINYCT